MKKISSLLIGILFLFSNCATVDKAQNLNSHNNTTEVVLADNNFKIIGKAEGQSEARYIFGIPEQPKRSLIAEAKADMYSKASIEGGSKAIINENVEIKHSTFPFLGIIRIKVSGYIVEFIEQ